MNNQHCRPNWLNWRNWKTPRWKTSIYRKNLSVPSQLLLKQELINNNNTVLDFGCGRGAYDGVNLLNQGFLHVNSFDPYYYPKFELLSNKYDIVLLNYVINVIESGEERQEVLRYCWNLCQSYLLVSVRIGAKGGVFTSTGTFQQYYTRESFTEFILCSLPSIHNYYVKGGVAVISKSDSKILHTT